MLPAQLKLAVNKILAATGTTSTITVTRLQATTGSVIKIKKFTMILKLPKWFTVNNTSMANGNGLIRSQVLKLKTSTFGSITKRRKFTMTA